MKLRRQRQSNEMNSEDVFWPPLKLVAGSTGVASNVLWRDSPAVCDRSATCIQDPVKMPQAAMSKRGGRGWRLVELSARLVR